VGCGVSDDTKLTDTVWGFIDRASEMYGRIEAERYAQEMQSNCLEVGMQSPIEHLFWIACHSLAHAHFVDVNPEPEVDSNGGILVPDGLCIFTQAQVRQYRVDFLVSTMGFGPREFHPDVVVELDGHDFHDKDKRQRSYEKRRDRDLVREGYKVIHFTGSDVVKDPFACAFEALEMAGMFVGTGIRTYDPEDPLCQGGS
jgi:very-short-patch-repair endonuclease